MDFLILGPLEVTDGDTTLPVPGAVLRSLLAVFLLAANDVVPTSRLVELLWSADAPASSRHAVHVHISRLRRALFVPKRADARLDRRDPGYVLRLDPAAIDANRFESLVHRGHALTGPDPRQAGRLFDAALALWRGPPLIDLGDAEFVLGTRARLEEMFLGAVEERFACRLTLGTDADLIGDLRGFIAEHPLRERPIAQLMVALYRSGRQAEALSAYAAARDHLADEIGVEPGPRLDQLRDEILRHDPDLWPVPGGHRTDPE
jgi:DNA-binding SARP family transcriptional activator